jgi:hypothetical protein
VPPHSVTGITGHERHGHGRDHRPTRERPSACRRQADHARAYSYASERTCH